MAIERHLHALLLDHELVIVPDWGGFLTHYRPARLDPARRLVHPPGRSVSFNRHIVRNDGLLADHLVRTEGVPFDKARAWIGTEVAAWRETLARDGRLELPRIGLFYRDSEQNLQFDPDMRADHAKDSFGLRALAAVPVLRAEPAPVVRPLPPADPEERPRRSYGRVAAAAAVLLVGLAGLWAVQRGGWGQAQWSGPDLWRQNDAPAYRMPEATPSAPVATAGIFTLPETAGGVRTVPLTVNDSVLMIVDLARTAVAVVPPESTAVAMPAEGHAEAVRLRFHVVGGCFSVEENADRFLTELRAAGHDAVRLPLHKRLHPVAYGSFATREEALGQLARVRADGSAAAWLMVK
ncbi:MAG: SPOR domain-containing protein [Flavobacteriales bacterium]|jgi:cell division septation protein DedD|nr:SPOR domain-containing protein [Flavobacteriales bacterium]